MLNSSSCPYVSFQRSLMLFIPLHTLSSALLFHPKPSFTFLPHPSVLTLNTSSFYFISL